MPADQTNEAILERDVKRTQDAIGDTVREIEDKLNPSDMTESLIGEDGMDTAREALDVARRSPLPVALIAIGAVWLFATSDAPAIRTMRDRLKQRFGMGGNSSGSRLRPQSAEPAPIGPPPPAGESFDRR